MMGWDDRAEQDIEDIHRALAEKNKVTDRWEIERLRSINADLLAALERIADLPDEGEGGADIARAAIAKAKGIES
jgi:plasmid stabilization system protein ParE